MSIGYAVIFQEADRGPPCDLALADQLCREALAERLDVAADHSALGDLQQRAERADGSVILTGSVPLTLVRQGGADSSSDAISTVECRVLDASS